MAKVQLKGIIKRVLRPETVGQNNVRKQTLILEVPAYTDEWGEKRGEDEEWAIDLFNDRIDKANLSTGMQGKRAIVDVYLNSRKFQRQNDGTDGYIINAVLGRIELKDAPAPQPSQNKNW